MYAGNESTAGEASAASSPIMQSAPPQPNSTYGIRRRPHGRYDSHAIAMKNLNVHGI